MIGTAFIAVGLWRVLAYHFTDNHHLGLELGIKRALWIYR